MMADGEEATAANASIGVGQQQQQQGQPQVAAPPNMKSFSNIGNEHQQNAIFHNEEESQKKGTATATFQQFPVAPIPQQQNLLNTASAVAAPVPGHLFFPPANPSAAASSTVGSLPFAGMPTLGSTHYPFIPLPQALAAAANEQQQRLLLVTPVAFRNTKLRSGKWLREEEAYAELLIDLFEKGHVWDCPNGTTLRCYLSQKLHCAPMRISKKYAGRGIGKMVYLCKLSSATSAPSGLSLDQQKQLDVVLQTTESKFVKAASPTNDFLHLRSPTYDLFSGGPIHAHAAAAAAAPPLALHHGLTSLVTQQHQQQPHGLVPSFSQQLPLFAIAADHGGANAALSQQQQAQAAAFAVAFANAATVGAAVDPSSVLAQQQQQAQAALAAATGAGSRVSIPVGAMTQHPSLSVAATVAGTTTNVAPTVQHQHHGQQDLAAQPGAGGSSITPLPHPGQPPAQPTGRAPQQQMHPAFVVGQQQAQQTGQLQMNPSLSSHTQHHHHQHHPQAALVSTHGAQGNTTATLDPRMQLQQAFLNSLMQASMSFPNQLQVPHAAATFQILREAPSQSVAPSGSIGNPGVVGESQAHSTLQSTSHVAATNELSDFLSGFDINSTTPNNAMAPMLHGSPPLTSSRSFDEFHRFLGDDLALLEQSTKEAAGVPPQDDSSKSSARVPGQQDSPPPCVVPDTMALFSADSYAMFAQESAMAASQHAAYSSSLNEIKKTRKSPTFDVEGVVKLVSEHVPTQNRQVTTPPVVDGNRAKNSPVNALDHLAEYYSKQQQQQHSQQHHHHRPHHPYLLRLASNEGSAMTMTQGLSAQSGQLLNSPNANAPQVSGSELASATETESSQPGSASESNASDSNHGSDSNNTGNEDSEDGNPDSMYSSNDSDASGSYYDEGPCPKKTKLCQWQTRPRNGASHTTNNEET